MTKHAYFCPKANILLNENHQRIYHQDQAQDKYTHCFHYYLTLVVLANAIREEKTIRGLRIGREDLQFGRWHNMMKTQGDQEENEQNNKSIQ